MLQRLCSALLIAFKPEKDILTQSFIWGTEPASLVSSMGSELLFWGQNSATSGDQKLILLCVAV